MHGPSNPRPHSTDETTRRAYYDASLQVLTPRVHRLKALMYFKDEVVSRFAAGLTLILNSAASVQSGGGGGSVRADKTSAIPCEGLLVSLINILDLIIVLDALKDNKACLSNDFSAYKRAFTHLRADIPEAEQIALENNHLQPFLANKETLVTALKLAVAKSEPPLAASAAFLSCAALRAAACFFPPAIAPCTLPLRHRLRRTLPL